MCVHAARITYDSFDRYDFFLFFYFFLVLQCACFYLAFLWVRKRCIDFEEALEKWWGSWYLQNPGFPPPLAKLGYLQSWGCLERLQPWLRVARPVPAACAIDLHWRQCVIRSPLETLTFKNSIKLIQLEPGEERLLARISHKTPEFSALDLFFYARSQIESDCMEIAIDGILFS